MERRTRAQPRRNGSSNYHHGELRAALLAAAAELLAGGGVDAVGMREIARRASVSHAAPYRHYASREALLADLAAIGFEQLAARFAALPPLTAPDRRLVEMARAYVDFARQQPQLWRLMFGNTLDKTQYPGLLDASRLVLASLRATVEALGVVAPATHQTLAAWAFAHGVARLVLDHRLDAHLDAPIDADALVQEAAEIFLRGLRATPTA